MYISVWRRSASANAHLSIHLDVAVSPPSSMTLQQDKLLYASRWNANRGSLISCALTTKASPLSSLLRSNGHANSGLLNVRDLWS